MGIFRQLTLLVIKPACRMAFDRRYLQGRWFEGRDTGWKWAWRSLWQQKFGGRNRNVPWPVSENTVIAAPSRLEFHPDDLNNFQSFGQYYNNNNGGWIRIGRGSYIGPNVGIVTSNHTIYELDEHDPPQDVTIGESCWIGMNAVILPGVTLGPHTVVAAGSVVGRSYPKGHVVLVGNPARVSMKLERHPDGVEPKVSQEMLADQAGE
ncbi:MAG: acyltransferase [Planctomycetales bacterium]|nr:acyltransferase [bacterium]UNM08026.1 MAG: acyltransferase [Planctomycetales bacterium]